MDLWPSLVEKTCGLFSLLPWLVQLLWCSLSVLLKTFCWYCDCSVNLRVGYTWDHQVIELVGRQVNRKYQALYVFEC